MMQERKESQMRAVIQRVESASVSVEGEIRGQIGAGFLVLIGVEEGDGDADFRYIAEKVPNLRVFEDEQGKMNRSLLDVGGELLAMFQSSLQAKAFTSTMTYEILLIVVIGGIGSITGSILGSFLYIACSEWWLRFLDDPMPYIGVNIPFMRGGFRMLVFSVIIMIVVLFFRKGIMGDHEFSWDGIINFFGKLFRKKDKPAKEVASK